MYNCWGFIAIYAVLLLNLLFTLFCRKIYFATIYALSCGEKLSPKVHLWRKNDKYQVWDNVVKIKTRQFNVGGISAWDFLGSDLTYFEDFGAYPKKLYWLRHRRPSSAWIFVGNGVGMEDLIIGFLWICFSKQTCSSFCSIVSKTNLWINVN